MGYYIYESFLQSMLAWYGRCDHAKDCLQTCSYDYSYSCNNCDATIVSSCTDIQACARIVCPACGKTPGQPLPLKEWLQLYLKATNRQQVQLARQLKLDPAIFSRIQQSRVVLTSRAIERLAHVLSLDPAYVTEYAPFIPIREVSTGDKLLDAIRTWVYQRRATQKATNNRLAAQLGINLLALRKIMAGQPVLLSSKTVSRILSSGLLPPGTPGQIIQPGYRYCGSCRQTKPTTEEYWHRKDTRLDYVCLACRNDYQRQRYATDPAYRERQRQYARNHYKNQLKARQGQYTECTEYKPKSLTQEYLTVLLPATQFQTGPYEPGDDTSGHNHE